MIFVKDTAFYIFRTPLDSNYKNVYDGFTTVSEYLSFLQSAFTDYLTILIEKTTSRNDTNGMFEVVISGYNSMELHDYNYISFSTTSGRKFAFIVGISSGNDGNASASTILRCKFDAWANHYLELKDSYNTFPVSRCTYDAFANMYYPNELISMKFPTKRTFIRSYNYSSATGTTQKYVVLWQRVLLSKTIHVSPSKIPYTAYDNLQQTGGLIPIYRPCALINLETRQPVKSIIFIDGPNTVGEGGTLITEDLRKAPYYRIAGIDGLYAMENTLTYSLPRVYNISTTLVDNDYIQAIITLDNNGRYGAGNVDVSVDGTDYPISANSENFFVCGYAPNNPITLKETFTITLPSAPTTPPRYGVGGSNIYNSERITREFPFDYYSLIIGGKEYPLIPSNTYLDNGTTFTIEVYINDMLSRSYRVIKNVDEDRTIKLSKIDTNLPMRIDQLEEYLAFNRNQITANLTMNTVNTLEKTLLAGGTFALGMAMGMPEFPLALMGAGAISNIAGNATQMIGAYWLEDEKQKDIGNKPDIYSSTSPDAQLNMYFGDDVILVHNQVDTTSPIYQDLIQSIHYEGIKNSMVLNIFGRRRDVFDCLSANVDLKCPLENTDRMELENAFMRGITFWHIVPSVMTTDRLNILKAMNKKVSNLSLLLV